MKTTIVNLMLMLLLSNCSSSDNINSENPIIGQWTLVLFQPGFSPDENFNNGEIVWDFINNGQVEVKISDNLQTNSNLPLGINGIYDYTINHNKITIDTVEYEFLLNSNTLTIMDQVASDGVLLNFNKYR